MEIGEFGDGRRSPRPGDGRGRRPRGSAPCRSRPTSSACSCTSRSEVDDLDRRRDAADARRGRRPRGRPTTPTPWHGRGACSTLANGVSAATSEAGDANAKAIDYARRAGDRVIETRLHASSRDGRVLRADAGLRTPSPCARSLLRLGEGDRRAQATTLAALAHLRAMVGDFERAREDYRVGRATLEELGLLFDAHTISIDSGPVELLAGDPVGGGGRAPQGLPGARCDGRAQLHLDDRRAAGRGPLPAGQVRGSRDVRVGLRGRRGRLRRVLAVPVAGDPGQAAGPRRFPRRGHRAGALRRGRDACVRRHRGPGRMRSSSWRRRRPPRAGSRTRPSPRRRRARCSS